MQYIIFDDDKYKNFYPLTLTRSTGDLRVGILKLRQRIMAYFKIEKENVIIPSSLEKIYQERHPDWNINLLPNNKTTHSEKINSVKTEETIFINSRIQADNNLIKKINKLPLNSSLLYEKDIIAAKLIPQNTKISSENLDTLFSNLKKIQYEKKVLWEYTWEFIKKNSEYIDNDFKHFFYDEDNYFEIEMRVTVINPYNIWIGEGTNIKPGVIIDASEGAVVLDENVTIMPNAVIIGPAYIGKNSIIKVGAKIYEGTSIGAVCKIGGEVEESIIQAFSNKQHDGFLGHSYLGEWVNLGADTNNSDLKNNYKNVKTYFYPETKKIDTGSQFVGVIIGDHSKTGINSTINTGTLIGLGCNLFGRDLIKDYIPSFSWGECSNLSKYKIEKFFETASTVKKRRKLELTINEKELYSKIAHEEIDRIN